ncbi:MAG: tRNA dihydrouridine synthase DusB [Simkaniaceae bacterium]|nr:tRNA dihydrouridine synthase DusB [Simkaniaceae bacterium]
MIKLKNLQLRSNILYAPLAGCSDYPFRKMGEKYRPGLMFCEMVKMDALVRHDAGTYRLLNYSPSMRPIGAQLCGSKLSIARESARIIEDLGFDVLDLNCGCPVDKVTKDGSGSGLLKNPELIGDILAEMIAAVSIPVTVKIRTGWDENSIVAPLITQIAEQAGAAAITIHGRTRAQAYHGNADWSRIAECKKVAKEIKVIGNGDVFSPEKAAAMFAETGVDGVLVSRGTLGQPYIAENIRRYLNKEPLIILQGTGYKDLLLEHLSYIIEYQDDRHALLDIRRVGCWYLKNGIGVKQLRQHINQSRSIDEVTALIHDYNWDEAYLAPA